VVALVDFNGEIIPEEDAHIPANSRAVAYGEGCFETLQSYQGKFLRLDAHVARLQKGLKELRIPTPFFSEIEIKKRIVALLESNNLSDKKARVRIQVGILDQPGHPPKKKKSYFSLITAYEIDAEKLVSVRLKQSSIKKIPRDALDCTVKWSQYIANLHGMREAKMAGFDDALMLTIDGFVSETTIANIFWVKGDTIFTPGNSCDALPGVTRLFVIETLRKKGYEIIEASFMPKELETADFVFITNSIKEWTLVSEYDGIKFDVFYYKIPGFFDTLNTQRDRELC
jgi:branched-subunit amino acid aminotransferase/4-amino-4-deoxychorismate lyase